MGTTFLTLFDEATLSYAIELMWKGMLGVFTVLIIIAIFVYLFYLLNKNKK